MNNLKYYILKCYFSGIISIRNMLEDFYFFIPIPILESIRSVALKYVWISYFIYVTLVFLWILQYLRVKKDYSNSLKRSLLNSILTVIYYHTYSLLIIYTSFCNLWAYSNKFYIHFLSFIIGSVVGGISGLYYLRVMIYFKSLKKMIGLQTNELITSGLFKKCRNPQTLSKGFAQIGVGIMGRSLFAIIIGFIWWFLNHLNILEEEKVLESLFGESYLEYCIETPRYYTLKKNNQ